MSGLVPEHITVIRSEFETRVQKNSIYSLRAFARDLGMSVTALSNLLNQKRGISEARAMAIAQRLGLTSKESELFVLSAVSRHARSSAKKLKAAEKLSNRKNQLKRTETISPQNFDRIQNWYHMALLELMELEACTHKIEWFSKKLGINPKVIEAALGRLIELGMVTYKNGRYAATSIESATDLNLTSKGMKSFHKDLLRKAEHALYFDSLGDREFLNMTFAFNRAKMGEAKTFIRDFQRQFAEKFYPENCEKDSVYQLSVQFFRIDHMEKRK